MFTSYSELLTRLNKRFQTCHCREMLSSPTSTALSKDVDGCGINLEKFTQTPRNEGYSTSSGRLHQGRLKANGGDSGRY